jgi:hypothetical protein
MSRAKGAVALREALLGQLAYLIDEVAAMRRLADWIPEPLQIARPLPEEPSVRETYGMLIAADEQVFGPALEALLEGTAHRLPLPNDVQLQTLEDWNAFPLPVLLDRLQQARRTLLMRLKQATPEAWEHAALCGSERWDVYRYVYAIVQHDLELLRALGYRLHSAVLPGRPRPPR